VIREFKYTLFFLKNTILSKLQLLFIKKSEMLVSHTSLIAVKLILHIYTPSPFWTSW